MRGKTEGERAFCSLPDLLRVIGIASRFSHFPAEYSAFFPAAWTAGGINERIATIQQLLLPLLQGCVVAWVVPQMDGDRFVLYANQGVQHPQRHIGGKMIKPGGGQRHMTGTGTSEQTGEVYLSVVRHMEEESHDAQSVPRCQHTSDVPAAERENLTILQLTVNDGRLDIVCMGGKGMAPHRQFPQRGCIHGAEGGFAA